MKKKDFALGILCGAMLFSGATAVAAGITAEPTWQNIYVNGEQVSMTAYNIAGNNYVKLRDIGQQVGFNVYWADGVQIDTDAPYTGEAPVQRAEELPTIEEIRQEMILRINEVRRENGVSELTVNQSLYVFRRNGFQLPMTPSTFTWRFKLILKKHALPEKMNVHSLRHSNASLLIANGTDVATVAGLLGHAQPSTTLDIYTHAFDKNKKAASTELHQGLEI